MLLKPVYILYEFLLERRVKKGTIPEHIAIIMDGNRRLARSMGKAPSFGHRKGAERLEEVIEWCVELGIKSVTTYAFSTENFNRSREEIEALFDLFEEYFYRVAREERIHRHGVRVRAIGRREKFPERVERAIEFAEERTKQHENLFLNIALAYGGRQEIVDATKKIAGEVSEGSVDPESIDEKLISSHLYTNASPDPDLIIRTSGEERISGFLLWQSAYSELYFCDTFWPGFRKIDFLRALRTYQERERRHGC